MTLIWLVSMLTKTLLDRIQGAVIQKQQKEKVELLTESQYLSTTENQKL